MSKALELRQERGAIAKEMSNIITGPKPDMSRWKQLNDQQETLRETIDAMESTDKLQTHLSSVRDRQLPNINVEHLGLDLPTHAGTLGDLDGKRSTSEYRKNFWGAMTRSPEKITPEMRAGLLSNDGSAGYLIPIGFQRELEIRLKSFAGLRQACRILTTASGQVLNWPTVDDSNNLGEYLVEGTETQLDTNDPAFGNVAFGSNLVSSKTVTVSVQTATDAFESVESILSELFSIRLARTTEPTYLTGSGSGQPNGLLTALAAANYTGGPSGSYVVLANGANANSGATGDTEINSIGTQDIDNLLTALDPAYQQGASYMAHSSTWSKLRGQLDKYGRPIWNVSLASGEPDTIWGKPYFNNQFMSQIGAGNISIICGNFGHYVIRDVVGMTMIRFNELFMQNYKIGFQMFMRTDGQLLQPAAFTVLQHRQS